jgi:hypothetical protein
MITREEVLLRILCSIVGNPNYDCMIRHDNNERKEDAILYEAQLLTQAYFNQLNNSK